ncbi:MAG: glycosyltransferase family protein [Planctomycetota bacterium]
MAKIIYGVAGEGFGHSSRSHLIGQRLLDAGHDVMFVGYKKSLTYLKQYFGERVREIFGLYFAYEDGRVDKSETLKLNLMNLPEGNRQNDELFKKYFEPFGPDLVISDFEPFSAWWAWRNRVPFISIDHEHVLTLCELEHPEKNWFSRLTSSIVTKCYYVGAVAYVIINFFKTPLRIDSAVLAPPVVRPVVGRLRASQGEHILLYSTSGKGEERLREVVGKFPGHKFHVYGFKTAGEHGNCMFKERSTEGFLADLAGARGVIASAGFSLISECLYLKKKMLVLPVAGQYEQIINAHYIEKLGLGVSTERLDEATLGRFLNQLDEPMPSDERILWPDNDKFFQILQEVFNRLHKRISIGPL